MTGGPLFTRTRTAEEGPGRPAGTQPCLARIFSCDRPSAAAARYPLGAISRVTIGRGPDGARIVEDGATRWLELRLVDSWMSSAHVRLERALGRWLLEDVGSKNGTLLNGLPVQRDTLSDGDLVEVGQTFFLYRDALGDLGEAPVERERPLSPRMVEREDFGLAIARALRTLGGGAVRFLPAAARVLIGAWPIDVERALRAALSKADGAVIATAHLPSPLPALSTAAKPRLHLEGEFWTVEFGGETVRLKDSDGLRYLAHLIDRPGVEVHANDLLALAKRGRGATAAGSGDLESGDLGDAGPLLDDGAKAAYKQRLEQLRATVETAEELGNSERAHQAEEEIEILAAELARAVGLGGRNRKASSAAERIRVNVTLRIRNALKRVSESCPPLGKHLEAAVRTGSFCSYSP